MNKIFILPSSLIFIILSSFTSSKVFSQTTRTFTDSGTFTVPAGVTSIIVEAWGGGGGGATRTNNANNGSGGGGGGGAYASSVITVTPGAQYTIVVGAGGAASTKGGDSTFGGAIVKAAGGNGAAIINNNNTSPPGALGGSDVNSIGTTKYPGGNGSKGGDNYGDNSGGGGGGAGSDGPGNHANGINGGDAKPQNGGSGARGVDNPNGTNYTGNNGNTFGGGGSGAKKTNYDDVMGGRGANGLVTLTYSCPAYSLTSTTVTPSVCPGSPATVTLNGTAASLPVGSYTVSYSHNSTSRTAPMTVNTAGTGSFTTAALPAGNTTITITNLRSGGSGSIGFCETGINSNNTATINVGAPNAPTVGSITQPDCTLDTGSVVLSDLPSGTWTLTRNDGVETTGTGSSKTITGLIPGTYTYTVTGDETSTSCSGLGTGLYAEYFNNSTLSGLPALTRTDATVSFDWGSGNPGSPITDDNFSVRWTGQIQPCYTENYTFSTNSDDGIRLWIDGVQVINNWTVHAPIINSSTPIPLVAGTKYDIELEYYESGGGAIAQLYWSSPRQPYQIIPQSQLFSEATGCTSTISSTIVISTQPNCWTGNDSNWNNPSNWLRGVPTPGTEATLNTIIPSGLSNYPVISNGATSGYVKTIVLENNTTITVMDNSLLITENLKLDGKIDLEGESQLLQDLGSTLDPTSSGTIEIDQQGTQDLYTYNYWSSPVISNTLDNSYTVAGVLRDGTDAENPRTINFINSGHNGSPGSADEAIGIAHYWIHKYNATSNTYSAWQRIRSTGTLQAGQGFTMKGVAPNALGNEQNYVFVGKPNNGDITLTLTAGNDYLIGNPYPSALDADEFILDNIADGAGRASENIINGALYFWDHFGGGSHNLADYQGGYATYTLMGGAVAIKTDTRINIDGDLLGTKEPTQYIPVAQGFFVSSILDGSLIDDGLSSPVEGGTITFKNSQRVFATESSGASVFMKSSNTKGKTTASKQVDTRQKIRLMFDSPKGYHRQLLVGVDERASNGFDLGFDAPLIETNKEDMFWIFKNNEFVIQAVDNFDEDQILPLGIKTNQAGISKIKIDGLENISNDFKIYLKDKELGIYHPINESPYEVYLEAGDYLDRFEVAFKSSGTLDVDDVIAHENIQVYFSNHSESIIVHNPVLRQIKSVELVNLLGQSIHTFEGTTQNYVEYKTNQISAGVYIIKVQTPEGSVSKKVLIK